VAYLFTMGVSLAAFRVRRLLLLAGLLLAVLLVNFRSQDWNNFHYIIGSKYFSELGYEYLYPCALQALGTDRAYRDMQTYKITRGWDCPSFHPLRWQQFIHDVQLFALEDNTFLDKGFNASPAWIAVFRHFGRWLIPLDSLLLACSFLIIGFRGIRRAFLLALFFFTFHSLFSQILGNAGQWVWLSLLLVAFSVRSVKLCGFLIGLSSSLVIFPVVFLLMVRKRRFQAIRYALLGIALGFFLGFSVSPSAWWDFLQNHLIHAHFTRSEPFHVGLDHSLTMISSWGVVQSMRGDWLNVSLPVAVSTPLWLKVLVSGSVPGLLYAAGTMSRYYMAGVLVVWLLNKPLPIVRFALLVNGLLMAVNLALGDTFYAQGQVLYILLFVLMGLWGWRRYANFAAYRALPPLNNMGV